MQSTLKQFMRKVDRDAIGDHPTTHQNCINATGYARPGKTARDRANGMIPYRRNRRIYDKATDSWIKI